MSQGWSEARAKPLEREVYLTLVMLRDLKGREKPPATTSAHKQTGSHLLAHLLAHLPERCHPESTYCAFPVVLVR